MLRLELPGLFSFGVAAEDQLLLLPDHPAGLQNPQLTHHPAGVSRAGALSGSYPGADSLPHLPDLLHRRFEGVRGGVPGDPGGVHRGVPHAEGAYGAQGGGLGGAGDAAVHHLLLPAPAGVPEGPGGAQGGE